MGGQQSVSRMLFALALVTSVNVTTGRANAQVLRCLAPGGQVEFAGVCPPGTKAEPTGIRNNPQLAPAKPETSFAERDAEFRKRRDERQEAARKAEFEARRIEERAADCASALAYQKSLQSGMRILRTDPKTGETAFLDDAERKSQLQRVQHAMDINCN